MNLGKMTRNQKIALIAAIALFIYTVFGFFILPPIARSVVEKKLTQALKRQVSVSKIKLNPYVLSATIIDLAVAEPDGSGNFVAFQRLYLNLQALSLFKKAIIIKECSLTGPSAWITHNADKTYSFSDLAGQDAAKEKLAERPAKPLLFSINNITISGGNIEYRDLPMQTTHLIRDLNLAIPFISNLEYELDNYVMPAFSAVVNDTPLKLDGRTKPFSDSRETALDIKLSKLDIPYYLAYVPDKQELTIKNGYLDINATLAFLMPIGEKPTIAITGNLALNDIDLTGPDGTSYLKFPELSLNISSSDLLRKDIHLQNLTLTSPHFVVQRQADGRLLPLALVPMPKQPKSPEAEGTEDAEQISLKLTIDDISLTGGRVDFSDSSLAEPFATTLSPIDLSLKNFSTIPGVIATYSVSAASESEEKITLAGEFGLEPIFVNGSVECINLMLPKYDIYARTALQSRLAAGRLSVMTGYRYTGAGSATATVQGGLSTASTALNGFTFDLQDFNLADRVDNSSIIKIRELKISDTEVDLQDRQATIGELASLAGEFRVIRYKDGSLNLQKMLKPMPKTGEPTGGVRNADRPWQVSLRKMALNNFSVLLKDLSPASPAVTSLGDIAVNATSLSTATDSKGKISVQGRINKAAAFKIKGELGINPMTASLLTDLNGLRIKDLQPYLSDVVKITVTDGTADIKGRLQLDTDREKKISARFSGSAGIKEFVALDPVLGEKFIAWKDLNVKEIEAATSPFALKIKDVTWQDYYSNLIVAADGGLNLKSVLGTDSDPSGQSEDDKKLSAPDAAGENERTEPGISAKSNEPPNIEIDSFTMKNGRVDFTDRSVKPVFSATLSEINGSITGLSSAMDKTGDVRFTSALNQHAVLAITGSLNLLRNDLFADLAINFKDIELSPMSPYSGRYIGYKIDKGKLSLDLKYLIKNREIQASNKVFLDQFTLGSTVESKDAVSLPISLAISLLKNRRGEISVDLPVHGNLDDPKFSLGGVIFKVLINLIAKAATSPFALLGALIPEGQDLQHVSFTAGSSQVSAEENAKLETIAKALYERPGLKMDISGRADPIADREFLQKQQFDRLLKAEKIKKLTRWNKNAAVPELDEIIIPKEYDSFLEKAYKTRKLPKLKRGRGEDKEKFQARMADALLASVEITDDDLRLLAIRRAGSVKDLLVETGGIESERLFVIEPQVPTENAAEQKDSSRSVKMTIK